jgi:hypothetical protein
MNTPEYLFKGQIKVVPATVPVSVIFVRKVSLSESKQQSDQASRHRQSYNQPRNSENSKRWLHNKVK